MAGGKYILAYGPWCSFTPERWSPGRATDLIWNCQISPFGLLHHCNALLGLSPFPIDTHNQSTIPILSPIDCEQERNNKPFSILDPKTICFFPSKLVGINLQSLSPLWIEKCKNMASIMFFWKEFNIFGKNPKFWYCTCCCKFPQSKLTLTAPLSGNSYFVHIPWDSLFFVGKIWASHGFLFTFLHHFYHSMSLACTDSRWICRFQYLSFNFSLCLAHPK